MGITVLSLFDGMSVGRCALKEMGIKVDKYYASEIDKHAIAQTQKNFPDTIQLGDVTKIDARELGHIDLLIGGSPCQSFSFAGHRVGMSTSTNEEIYTLDRYLELKNGGFEFEGESYLFWEYMRILHEIRETNPDVFFFLENVCGREYVAFHSSLGRESCQLKMNRHNQQKSDCHFVSLSIVFFGRIMYNIHIP